MHPHNGWPTAAHAKAPDFIRPITPNAKYLVRCSCGYAHDSAAHTKPEAIADISARHACPDATWTAEAYKA